MPGAHKTSLGGWQILVYSTRILSLGRYLQGQVAQEEEDRRSPGPDPQEEEVRARPTRRQHKGERI